MRKILPVLILLVIPLNIIFAQSSPFGSMSNGEDTDDNGIKMQGQQVDDYVNAMDEYGKILDLYEKAYGSQKSVLEKQLIARSKDAMYSKLGAIETYLDALIKNAVLYEQINDDDKETLELKLGDYRNKMSDYGEKVTEAEDMTDMTEISEEFNNYLRSYLAIKNKHISRISAVRGLEIIEIAMNEIDLMRFHLDSAASLGHDTDLTKTKFDGAMLKLEEAKDVYLEVQSTSENLNILDDTSTSTYVNRIITTNRDVISAQEELKEVVTDLRQFFGYSPWEVDFKKASDGDAMDSMDSMERTDEENLMEKEEVSDE